MNRENMLGIDLTVPSIFNVFCFPMPKTISPERILYEDNDLLVVNKLAGELVVAADGEND